MSMQSGPPPPGVESTESAEVFYDSVQIHTPSPAKDQEEEERDSGYEDNKEFSEDSDMERRPRTRRAKMSIAPAIPQRNERRASKVLDNLLLDLTSLDGTQDKQRTSIVIEENPHEVYLSSEEDASLSDDFFDSEFDNDMEDSTVIITGRPASRPSSRKSQEDTARVVSFVMVGKPQIVVINLPSPTSSPKRQSTANSLAPANTTSKRLSKRPPPLNLGSYHDDRRMSVASVTSTTTTSTTLSRPPPPDYSTSYIAYNSQPHALKSTPTTETLPLRKSSRLAANLSSLKSSLANHARSDDAHRLGLHTNPTASFSALPSQPVQQHAFLNMDPFEAAHRTSTDDAPPTPKTPTGMSSAAWRKMGGKGREAVTRTLSKARKGSMGKLNLAYTTGALQPRHHVNDSRISLATTTNLEQADETHSNRYSEEQEIMMLQRRSVTMPMHLVEDGRRPSTSSSTNEMGQPGRYQDMLRRVVAKATAEVPPASKGPSFRMTLARKKSVRA